KPSNVLLDGEGTAALADFGLARGPDSTRLTAEGQLLGTPHYLAPELIEGGEATRQSDVYALGCVLFECLAGAPPFAGRGAAEIGFAHLTEPPPIRGCCGPTFPRVSLTPSSTRSRKIPPRARRPPPPSRGCS